jgi:tripartite-type tricarboxylate transporter receptor subunit TctC
MIGKRLGQSFVIDNKPGATGIIGNDIVAKAAPDGQTLLFTYAATVVINQTLQPKMPYDGLRDLAPIAQIGAGGNFLVVAPDFPPATSRSSSHTYARGRMPMTTRPGVSARAAI